MREKYDRNNFFLSASQIRERGRKEVLAQLGLKVWRSLPKLKLGSRGLSKLALLWPCQKDPISREPIWRDWLYHNIVLETGLNSVWRWSRGDNWHRWTSSNYFSEYKALFSPHKIVVASKKGNLFASKNEKWVKIFNWGNSGRVIPV